LKKYLVIFIACVMLFTAACSKDNTPEQVLQPDIPDNEIYIPEESTFFATVQIDEKTTKYSPISDGDLWPAAWSDDGNLYAANGDGKGFNMVAPWSDIVVNRVDGHPEEGSLRGE